MNVNENFVLRKMADKYALVPIGDASEKFNGIISLNETGAKIWELIRKYDDIEFMANELIAEYNIDSDKASKFIVAFIDKFVELGCITKEK